jgi:hypothetical protein
MNPKMFTQIFKNFPFLLLNLFLVGGFNPSEKYSSIGINDYFQYMEPTKMFQSTNQQYIHYSKARFIRLEPDEILV